VPASREPADSPFARALPRWAPLTFWLTAVAAVAATAFLPLVRFDHDFASLEDAELPAFQLDRRVNRLLGRSQTPLWVLSGDAVEARAAAAALRAAAAREGSGIQLVVGLDDLVPDDVEAKRAVMAGLREELEATREGWLDAPAQRARADLLALTRAEPFGRDDLPAEVARPFGPDGAFVVVFPRISLSDGKAVQGLAAELAAVRLPDGSPLTVAGEALVLADVLDTVEAEMPAVLALTIAAAMAALLLFLGPALTLGCVAQALATLAITAGLMPLMGLSFNYLDILMVPLLFGMSIDSGVHLLTRFEEERDVARVVSETGRGVAGAIMTTVLAFGALMLAHHPGLRSLGAVAVVGLAVNVIVTLVAVPSLLLLIERARELRARGPLATRMVVTLGLAGDAPIGPGTLGALIALPLALFAQRLGVELRAAVAAAIVVGAVVTVERYLHRRGDHDHQEVVVDELAGCMVAVLMVPEGLGWAVLAFVAFRALDILKPWPIGFIDRRVRGAIGVVGDDVVAGVIAGAMILGLHHLGNVNGWWL
jgi:hypothetical protein